MSDEGNPLLITPPPGLLPAANPAPAPAETEPDDPEEFITLPPGIADSATHRVANARIVPPRATPADSAGSPNSSVDEIVFFPVMPGRPPVVPSAQDVPSIPSAAGEAAPASVPTVSFEAASAPLEGSVDETRASVTRRDSTTAWSIVLPTGQSVPVASAVIIGRDPVANAAWPAAALLPALDPAKSLSKTHALLELEGGILWVHDLDSTNGVFVVAPGMDVVQVDPGTRVLVPDGAEVELGEFIVTVVRA
ncbi:FHA domain-containing protein [Glaciihabitans sp. INWT7]|uniref:FHA domain-containing protein n=1 Tax=Glaciihabitans sp. INWT7 TaxID=2596912 RepID=UPI0016255989|nr:FHA domain-containing protein [Glaciihabitans sp. INWT7]QNE47445.1 FHA domain-containing protein [Glaciihabitans sp. INWT7]